MTVDEALDIGADFQKYLSDASNESLIGRYLLPQLKQAKQLLHRRYRNTPWYDELLKRIGQLEVIEEEKRTDKWWDKPLFVCIVSVVLTGVISWLIALAIFNKQKSDINEIQIVLADKNKEIASLREENQKLKNKASEPSTVTMYKHTYFKFP